MFFVSVEDAGGERFALRFSSASLCETKSLSTEFFIGDFLKQFVDRRRLGAVNFAALLEKHFAPAREESEGDVLIVLGFTGKNYEEVMRPTRLIEKTNGGAAAQPSIRTAQPFSKNADGPDQQVITNPQEAVDRWLEAVEHVLTKRRVFVTSDAAQQHHPVLTRLLAPPTAVGVDATARAADCSRVRLRRVGVDAVVSSRLLLTAVEFLLAHARVKLVDPRSDFSCEGSHEQNCGEKSTSSSLLDLLPKPPPQQLEQRRADALDAICT